MSSETQVNVLTNYLRAFVGSFGSWVTLIGGLGTLSYVMGFIIVNLHLISLGTKDKCMLLLAQKSVNVQSQRFAKELFSP